MIAPNVYPVQKPLLEEGVVKTKTILGKEYKCKSYRAWGNISRWKVLVECPICNKNAWVNETTIRYKDGFKMCKNCNNERFRTSGKNHIGYKNGKTKKPSGYVYVLLEDTDPLLCMSITGNYVAEHRYLVAKKIGRPLKTSEHIHHLNGIKDDNRIENLKLVNGEEHMIITQLEQRVKRLEKENKRLKNKLKKGGAT